MKHFNDSKAFIEYSNDMVNICKKTEEYISNKKRKILIVVDDITADIAWYAYMNCSSDVKC